MVAHRRIFVLICSFIQNDESYSAWFTGDLVKPVNSLANEMY